MSDPNSADIPLETLMAQTKAALAQNERDYGRFKDARRKLWVDLLGSAAEELLNSRELAIKFLSHPEPNCRIGALDILSAHWSADDILGAMAERMAFQDPDDEVQAVAVLVFCDSLLASNNREAARRVANLVRDQSKTEKLRSAAYCGLFRIAGMPVETWPDPTAFRFPAEVNWDFVNRFMEENL